jgi:Outer membrane protein beta-barrel domain
MKNRILLVLSAVLLSVATTRAQVIQDNNFFKNEFGVKVGLNYQMVAGSPWIPKLNSGIIGGLYKDFTRGKEGWRIELFFTEAHYTTVHPAAYYPGYGVGTRPADWDVINKGDFEALYLRLPILAEFRIYKSLHFVVGPEYSQQISITDNNGAFSKDFAKSGGLGSIFKKPELMVATGIEAKLKHRINLGLRMSLGLTSINEGAAGSFNNFRTYDGWKVWSLQASCGFRLKGSL